MTDVSSTPWSDPSRARLRPLLARAGLAVAAAVGLVAGVAAGDPPADPYSLQHDPHVLDTTGLCGGTVVDPFGNQQRQAHGRRIVQMPNGDLLVVALAPRYGQDPAANGLWNIGLVRYTTPCRAIAWDHAGQYGFQDNRYLVYPGVDDPRYGAINDVQVQGSYIYVLADRHETTSGSSARDVYVVVFHVDGTFVGIYPAMNSDRDERGAGLAFYQDTGGFPKLPPAKFYVAGTSYDIFPVTGPRPTLVRMTRNANGGLSRDSNLGSSGNSTYLYYTQPDELCEAGARPCQAVTNDIALTVDLFGALNRVYLAGAVRFNGSGNWDYLTIAVNYNGVPDSGFGINGQSIVWFDRPGSNGRDVANAIVARNVTTFPSVADEVYLVGEVAQQAAAGGNNGNRGIGVVKLGNNGYTVSTFANNGQLLFGGCAALPCMTPFQQSDDAESYPRSMVLSGDRLLIAGREGRRPPCVISVVGGPCVIQPHGYSGELAVVTRESGIVIDHGSHLGNSNFYGVLAGPGGRITTVGTWFDGGLARALTAQFRSDRLFGDGFQ